MTSNTLNGSRNASLLLIHRGCTLAPSSCRRLSIETLLRCVMCWLHLSLPLTRHSNLLSIVCGVRRIRRRSTLLMSRIHIVVYWRSLVLLLLLVLVHLHCVSRLGRRLSLRSLRSSLLAKCFCLLLLLHPWRRRFRRRWGFEIHGWHKRLSKFLLCNKWM